MTFKTYQIEKGVPAPDAPLRYPFPEMEVGDSFFTPGPRKSMASAAFAYGAKTGRKFTTQRVDGGYRCWRIE